MKIEVYINYFIIIMSNHTSCQNRYDLINNRNWDDDYTPNIKIHYYNDDKEFMDTYCYFSNSLIQDWLINMNNYYHSTDNQEQNTIYIKMPDNNYIIPDFLFYETDEPQEYIAVPIDTDYSLQNINDPNDTINTTIYNLVAVEDEFNISQYFIISNSLYHSGELENIDEINHHLQNLLNDTEEQEFTDDSSFSDRYIDTEMETETDEQMDSQEAEVETEVELQPVEDHEMDFGDDAIFEVAETYQTLHINFTYIPRQMVSLIIDMDEFDLDEIQTIFIEIDHMLSDGLIININQTNPVSQLQSLTFINHTPNQVFLDIHSIRNLPMDNIVITNMDVLHYAVLPNVIRFEYSQEMNNGVLDLDIDVLFPNLEILILHEFDSIDVDGLSQLGNLQTLEMTNFNNLLDELPNELIELLQNNSMVEIIINTTNLMIDIPEQFNERVFLE